MLTNSTATVVKYRHPVLGEDIPAGIPGYYTPEREILLPYKGREVLIITGKSVLEASCCGVGKWTYASVAGYVINWHVASEEGRAVSEVEPVTDPAARDELRQIIEARDLAEAVQFV